MTAAEEVLQPEFAVALCSVPVYIYGSVSYFPAVAPPGSWSDSGEVQAMTSHRSCETLLAVMYPDLNTQTVDKSVVP
jgi:hypothetical protein